MKPKAPSEHEDGLLEYLEDIIGTSRFKEPIEEALQEMEKYTEDRAEKLNRLKIVQRERDALEQEKKEAEDYLRLQNEHIRALSRLWQYYLWTCLRNEQQLQKRIVRITYGYFVLLLMPECHIRKKLRKNSRTRLNATRTTSHTWRCFRSTTRSGAKLMMYVATNMHNSRGSHGGFRKSKRHWRML